MKFAARPSPPSRVYPPRRYPARAARQPVFFPSFWPHSFARCHVAQTFNKVNSDLGRYGCNGITAFGTPATCPRRNSSPRSEEHTSELQSLRHLVCRLLLEKKKK